MSSRIVCLQVAAYEFTTLTCIPGVVHYRGAKIQMLDLPGIIEGAKDGKGRGRQVHMQNHLQYLRNFCMTWLQALSDSSTKVTAVRTYNGEGQQSSSVQ